jgi:hypothetical protein
VFSVPGDWPVYGDTGVDEYLDNLCEFGDAPAAYVLTEEKADREIACDAGPLLRQHPALIAAPERLARYAGLGVYLDDAPQEQTVIRGHQVDVWFADGDGADGPDDDAHSRRLYRFTDLGLYVLTTEERPKLLRRILSTFESA